MDIGELGSQLNEHVERLRAAREEVGDHIAWYPYDILANVVHLDGLLQGEYRDLDRLAQGRPVADIGAADGDLAFTLEHAAGWEMDIVDNAPTNMNGLDGARALAKALDSRTQVHDVDLDRQFRLPREDYGLVLLLGTLYHLQNPYYTLRELAERADHCVLSTRVARFAGPADAPIGDLPVAYLVDPTETNNDPTNYWIFSSAGLERIVRRAGWEMLLRHNVGDTENSNPSAAERDEREFLLLRSRLRTA